MSQGLIRRVGDGQSTEIWYHNWLPRPHNMRPITSMVANPSQLVGELILSDASWDRHVVTQVFLPTDAAAIFSIPLCTKQIDDFWSWAHERNGVFFSSIGISHACYHETQPRSLARGASGFLQL